MKHDKKTGLIATSDDGFDRTLNGENAVFVPTLLLSQERKMQIEGEDYEKLLSKGGSFACIYIQDMIDALDKAGLWQPMFDRAKGALGGGTDEESNAKS
jgi:hypothetical protein